MASGLLNIASVSGAAPNWVLTVNSVGLASVGDHVACSLDGLPVGDGAPYRVTGIPDSITIEVTDDLKPGGGEYGKPGGGPAQFYTPTTNLRLSQPADSGPFWGESLRRDNLLLDNIINTLEDRVGWLRVVNVLTQSGQPVSGEVWEDPPYNTILQEVTSPETTIRVVIECSYPKVYVNGQAAVLPLVGSIYRGTVDYTVAGEGDVVCEAKNPDGNVAASDTILVRLALPPVISSAQFTGGYPGSQTELKAGDNFDIQVVADKNFDQVRVLNYEACILGTYTVPAGVSATITAEIADRGTTAVARPARVQVRDAVTGAWSDTKDTNDGGGSTDGVHAVLCNNLYPSVSIGAVTYPATQQALKGSETATVVNTVSNFTTVAYDDPTGSQLNITNPASYQTPKTVTRSGGTYNISSPNFRVTANRAANDATTVQQGVVKIANVAATITVSEQYARLRSGGNDGTTAPSYTITVTSDQQLLAAPTLNPEAGGSKGTFIGSWSGGPSVWMRQFQIHDEDAKGIFTWAGLSATNLAGIVTSSISGNDTYTLGGFVARTVTWDAFQTISRNLNVAIVDFNKIQAGIFSATNQQSTRYPISTAPPQTDGYTSEDPVGTKPHNVEWLDTTAASSNTGEAYLYNYEEVV